MWCPSSRVRLCVFIGLQFPSRHVFIEGPPPLLLPGPVSPPLGLLPTSNEPEAPGVKYAVDVAEGELLVQDLDHSVLKSSPISLVAPPGTSPPNRRGGRGIGRTGPTGPTSPCSVTGGRTSFAKRLLLRLRDSDDDGPGP